MWDRAWSTAIVCLRLPAELFWKLTPRQLQLLVDTDRERIDRERDHHEFLSGTIAAQIANYAGRMLKEGVQVKPQDFMPRLKAANRKSQKRLPVDFINTQIRCFLLAQKPACAVCGETVQPGIKHTCRT